MAVITVGTSPQTYKYMYNHTHTAWEIVLNTEGVGYTDIGEKRYSFEPGTIICQPPNVLHSKYSDGGFRDIFIQSTIFSLSNIESDEIIVLHDDTEKTFETLIFMAHRIFHKKEMNNKSLVDALFDTMDQLIVSWYQHNSIEEDIDQLTNQLINSFTDAELSIAKLLSEGKYNNDHLRRRFKKATGKTPMEYLLDLRIDYAKKLLRENQLLNYTIGEIGAMTGYYDSCYFSRIFKKKVGVSPNKYAKY
jgi:AraC-type DNA-binding domain-containing proteins